MWGSRTSTRAHERWRCVFLSGSTSARGTRARIHGVKPEGAADGGELVNQYARAREGRTTDGQRNVLNGRDFAPTARTLRPEPRHRRPKPGVEGQPLDHGGDDGAMSASCWPDCLRMGDRWAPGITIWSSRWPILAGCLQLRILDEPQDRGTGPPFFCLSSIMWNRFGVTH